MPQYSADKAIRAAIITIAGDLVGDRVYSDEAVPQSESFPYVSFMLVGDTRREKSHKGAMSTVRARYQVDCYGETKEQVSAIVAKLAAPATEGGLDGYKGQWIAGDGSVFVQSCWLENHQHDSLIPASAQEKRVFFAGFDARICFNA